MRHPSGVAVVTSVNRPARPSASIRQRTSATAASAPRIFTPTGYDPAYGARPLKRAIQKNIETRLGFLLLENKVRDGERVLVDYDRNSRKLVFNPKPSPVGVEVEATRA